ncbi:MAM domain-containing glycosylphosphatidylinositol anchor protein 1 [Liparis tanakae]|uniref:MAM domain-containing glycosylphosphatidylinositol anchor protein 1 n=1 Tax=Liparis tanakae TaxID=230148 RepID=A0A4Z2GDE3_9TELE|nr:MAM domain-containing glycosylphosphatidylinositol anchor protein 1 [Liparis tanakae]
MARDVSSFSPRSEGGRSDRRLFPPRPFGADALRGYPCVICAKCFFYLYRATRKVEHRTPMILLLKSGPTFLWGSTLNLLLRVRSIASVDSVVWTKFGHQGPDWRKAFLDISPSGPFQSIADENSVLGDTAEAAPPVCEQRLSTHRRGLRGSCSSLSGRGRIVFEGIRGAGFEGDIAVDDVSITVGKCKQGNTVASAVLIGGSDSLPLASWLTFGLSCVLSLLCR